ncbi:MAG: AsmA family protein [Methylophilaceae bacterium]|nr:AsmA family protein [Methylophilaceae bacterium]
MHAEPLDLNIRKSLPRRTKIAWAIAAAVLAFPACVLLVLLTMDWNHAKPWLNARASMALGRPFTIAGDLALSWDKAGLTAGDQTWRAWLPWPHLVARDIHIGNPAALTVAHALPAGEMAHIKSLAFSLNPLALLSKKIVIPMLRFEAPVIHLQRDIKGHNNWTFNQDGKPLPWQLELQGLVLSQASVHLQDAIKHADVTASMDTLKAGTPYGVAWQLQGQFNGESISGSGKAGAVLSLQQQNIPYPILANLRMGQTLITAQGTLTKPADLVALDMQLKVSGVSMGRLYALSGIYLPETPPFATAGHLIGQLNRHGARWSYDKFTGRLGASDISGHLDYQSGQARPLLTGSVVSHLLQLADLAPLIGADSRASQAKRGAASVQPANKRLPVEPFTPERWDSVDADIHFSAEKILHKKSLPINKLSTMLHLHDSVLSLAPLDFDMAGGKLGMQIKLDASGSVGKQAIKAEIKASARHLRLKQLFPTLQPLQASAGEINADASLSAVGNSVATLLGAANGEIKMLINQGTISKLLLEEMGLNVGNIIVTHVLGDKQVKLNCMALDMGVTQGLMQTRYFMMDTDAAILMVNGQIDLAQEQLDLTIKPNSKGLRVFSLSAPLYVRGDFIQPQVTIDKGVLAMRVGGAIALAALAPFAAVIPFVVTGSSENSACAKLLAETRVKPVAPPPGKTYRQKPVPHANK